MNTLLVIAMNLIGCHSDIFEGLLKIWKTHSFLDNILIFNIFFSETGTKMDECVLFQIVYVS